MYAISCKLYPPLRVKYRRHFTNLLRKITTKEEQLTIYALALARLTALRLYHFKCAWFDEENYYEFYPLHVVYKKKKRKQIRSG
jgi:hypothetical protein